MAWELRSARMVAGLAKRARSKRLLMLCNGTKWTPGILSASEESSDAPPITWTTSLSLAWCITLWMLDLMLSAVVASPAA